MKFNVHICFTQMDDFFYYLYDAVLLFIKHFDMTYDSKLNTTANHLKVLSAIKGHTMSGTIMFLSIIEYQI